MQGWAGRRAGGRAAHAALPAGFCVCTVNAVQWWAVDLGFQDCQCAGARRGGCWAKGQAAPCSAGQSGKHQVVPAATTHGWAWLGLVWLSWLTLLPSEGLLSHRLYVSACSGPGWNLIVRQ